MAVKLNCTHSFLFGAAFIYQEHIFVSTRFLSLLCVLKGKKYDAKYMKRRHNSEKHFIRYGRLSSWLKLLYILHLVTYH